MFDFTAYSHKLRETVSGKSSKMTATLTRVTKLHFAWIFLQIVLLTFYISVQVIYDLYRGILNRRRTDSLIHFWSSTFLKIMKMKVNVVGSHHLNYQKNRCYLLMSNHSSTCDIPVLLAALPGSVRMLSRNDYFRVPIWGNAMRLSEFLSIDRMDRLQAIQDLEYAKQKMESGIILWGAPEGTRSRTGHLLPFKKGLFITALQMNAVIIPIGLRGLMRPGLQGQLI